MNVKDRIKGLFQQAEFVVFFFFLTTSLFLGDGKQPFGDDNIPSMIMSK